MDKRLPSADKAAIDADLLRLCRAAGVKVKLPAANPDPKVGPFSHLRDALKILPRDRLIAKLPAFLDSWIDTQLCYGLGLRWLTAPPMAEVLTTKRARLQPPDRAILEAGLVALAHTDAQRLLVLSPGGPGAAVFSLGPGGLVLLGRSVAEFIQREVDTILGGAAPAITSSADVLARVASTAATTRRIAGLRKRQVAANRVEAALVYGRAFDDLRGPEDLFAIDDLARAAGLSLYFGRGDAENASDSDLATASWLVGAPLWSVKGGPEQKPGFELDARAFGKAKAKVDGIAKAAATVVRGTKMSVAKPGHYLVARGGACTAWLVRGSWLAAPAKTARDPDALVAWLEQQGPRATPGSPAIGHARGTQGASQRPLAAVVRGICIAGADGTIEPVTLSAARDKVMDRALAAGGIARPRYFLVTRFD